MSTPVGTDLASRYGRPVNASRRRRAGWVALIAVVVVGLSFIVWVSFGKSDTAPSSKDVSFNIVDPAQVQVTFTVVPDTQRTVNCSIQALNEQFAVVGYREVTVAPNPAADAKKPQTLKIDVRTQQLAVTGGIDHCSFS